LNAVIKIINEVKGMKVKLTIFIPTMSGGGAEKVIANLINNFDFEKYQITLLIIKDNVNYEINRNVRIEVLGCRSLRTALPLLTRYLKKSTPDIMISNMSLPNIISTVARFLSGRRFPLLLVEHSTPSIKYKDSKLIRKLIPFLMRATYRFADQIISVSKDAATDLQKLLKYKGEIIKPIYNPIVDSQLDNLMNKSVNHRWLDNKNRDFYKVVIGVGRLEEVKNFRLLIEAFYEVHKVDSLTRLIILGEGSQRPELEELIDKLNLTDVVDLIGFVENPYSYLKRSSLFVLSSNLEGLPTVLIEALACGVPIVSTNCQSGPREILDDGKYGQLVPIKNKEKLKDAILIQLKNTHDQGLLRNRAMFFSVENSVNKYDAILSELLKVEE